MHIKESTNINLNNLTMNAVETDENGVIDFDTIFNFHQQGEHVYAEYHGGKIEHGYLVGINKNNILEFRYCQLESGGILNGGSSTCELRLSDDSLVQIIENFVWESRPGSGRNVMQELIVNAGS